MQTYSPCYILTAALEHDGPAMIDANNAELARQLRARGFAVDHVFGCYKGVIEAGLIAVPFARALNTAESDVLELAAEWDQESVLAIDANRNARLLFARDPECAPVSLGLFRNVPEHVARARDAWTERNGQYYVAGDA